MSGWQSAVSPQPSDDPERRWIGAAIVALLCMAIFIIDTYLPYDMAIAVLYLVVVILAASFFERQGVLVVGAVCIGLTALSFAIMHWADYNFSSVMRCLVSLSAIFVTTLLTLRHQAAIRSLRHQAALLDLSHDAIFVRSPADIITYWNRGAERLYGWSRDEAEGRKAGELLKTQFPGAPGAFASEVLRTGQWDGELTQATKDGGTIIAESRWSLQRDARGRPIGTLETNHDITERKLAEEKLHEAQAELAHVTRLSTMGELTASITHEVNQPLAAVVTNGEACLRWLGRPVPDIGEATITVERMIANARRASDVVARLRALARGEDPEHRPVCVSELVDDCVMLLERELSTHRVRLDRGTDPRLPPVLGDRVQFQQVLINLALNAIQAMDDVPRGRRVLRIAAALVDGEGAPPGAPALAISVEDSGPGVAPEAVPSLFTPFYSTKKDGIGIGLSISRSIVEAHGGRIAAALREKGGMCFTVTLPIAKEALS